MISTRTLAGYVLRTLAVAQNRGRKHSLETIAELLEVRRVDVRTALSALHREGHLDVRTMRLTLSGFAIGTALRSVEMPALRTEKREATVAALEASAIDTRISRVLLCHA